VEERRGAVVALKELSEAKSRFSSLHPAVRRRLAELMAVTVACALTPVVDELVVVTAAPGIPALLAAYGVRAHAVPDPGTGLNPALVVGATELLTRSCRLLVACMADLPALTAVDVTATLAGCTGPGRWFVPDAAGTGTTVLVARDEPLAPAFGDGSAARHRAAGAVELRAPAGVRRDVDDAADLAEAVRIGLQPPASSLIGSSGDAWHDTAVVAGVEGAGWMLITSAGTRAYAPATAAGADLRSLATGQRVHLMRDSDGSVHHVWL
jgi:2-phospho-L-lactate guanylyltransferase